MIADTTFLIQWVRETRTRRVGPARAFISRRRPEIVRTTIISLTEVAVSFPTADRAWEYFGHWSIYRLHDGIARVAADLDRGMAQRLGENENWIAGFCLYYRQPVISLDSAFDRVRGLRRLAY